MVHSVVVRSANKTDMRVQVRLFDRGLLDPFLSRSERRLWFVISIYIDPRPRDAAELLSLSAGRCGRELLSADLAPASAEAVSWHRWCTGRDRRCECTAHPEGHTVADSLHLCCPRPAWQLDGFVQPLPFADVWKVLPPFSLRCDGFRGPSFFPIAAAVVHTFRSDDFAADVSELHVSRSQLYASAFEVCDRNSLDCVAVNSHVRDRGNVLDHEPFRLAFRDDSAGLLKHQPAVHHAGVVGFCAMHIGHAETLTRRARHDAVEPARDPHEFADVSAGDFVLGLYNAKTRTRECTVEKADAGEQGENELSHGLRVFGFRRKARLIALRRCVSARVAAWPS